MSNIPVSIITGFLGSGKTTLLNQILQEPEFKNAAVIVNELGEVGIDHYLVSQSQDKIVRLTTGCLCCTTRGDIRDTLIDLAHRVDKGIIPPFSRVIIETTGVADPAPVIHTFINEKRLANRFALGNVIAVFDANQASQTIDPIYHKQLLLADIIVISKSDMLSPEARDSLQERLCALNSSAVIWDKHQADFKVEQLFVSQLYDPMNKSPDVQAWLRWENANVSKVTSGHINSQHHGDIQVHNLVLNSPLPRSTFNLAFQLLTFNPEAEILRVKGIICLEDQPERPLVIHGVQHMFHQPVELKAWPSQDRRSRLVMITRNIDPKIVEGFFKAWKN